MKIPQNMADKSVTDFISQVHTRLSANDYVGVEELLNNEDNLPLLQASGWDLVPKVCDFLTAETTEQQRFVQCCQDVLMRLCEVGNVKELLLASLEQADCFIDDTRYVTLLGPIQKCLLALPGKKGPSLAVALETLYGQLGTLQKPELQQVGTKEGRILMENDENIRRIVYLVGEVLHFLSPFVEEVKKLPKEKRPKKQCLDMTTFLIKLLNFPLCFLDYSVEVAGERDQQKVTKSSGAVMGEKLMGYVARMNANLAVLLEQLQLSNKRNKTIRNKPNASEDGLNVEEDVPEMGMAMLAYLALGESMQPQMMPQVFTAVHWLCSIGRLILMMLKHQELVVVLKGLQLMNGVLVKSQALSLNGQGILWKDCKAFVKALVHVMTTSQDKEVMQKAIGTFGFLLSKFDHVFRYKTISFLLHKSNHSGILGHAVKLLKDEVDASLTSSLTTKSSEFTDKKLLKLFKLLFTLPEEEKTNLLDRTEYIMGILNLLRYLVLRDKPASNATGIWHLMPHIESNYLEHIRKAITLSRAHYELDIDNVKQGKKLGMEEESAEMEFTVSGQSLPGMTPEQKLHVLQMALHTFDMIESILGRVVELVDQARKG